VDILTEGQLDPPASPEVIRELSVRLGVELPADYVALLQCHNGGEGFIGDNYIVLWKAEEVPDFNREYEVHEYAPGILLFGSDGAGEGYGFDTRTPAMPIVRVPFIGMDLRYATPVAANIQEMFLELARSK
jgi:hypothetical protein